MGKKQRSEKQIEPSEHRRIIGQRVRDLRLRLPGEASQLKEFADRVNLSDSLLSRIESGTASLPLDAVERIVNVTGCRPEAIITGNPYPETEEHPFQDTVTFLQQAQLLGVDGLFPERTSALGYLLAFAEKMRGGRVHITGSSLRGLEQRSEHGFVRCLTDFGRNPTFEVKVIMTHPKLGSKREYQERRPPGSIIREIFTGINWCLDVLQIIPTDIRLSIAGPSSFSIFLIDGPEARAIINPYPTMRQAFLSYTLAVRNVPADGRAGEVVSIYQTYLKSNFHDPWEDDRVTVGLEEGLKECRDCIANESEGSDELEPHRDMLERTLEECQRKQQEQKERENGSKKGRVSRERGDAQNDQGTQGTLRSEA